MSEASTNDNLKKIKHIILVLSGKGGVGKSSVTCQLAATLVNKGNRVGVLDVDLCGPSIPRLLGVEDQTVMQAPIGWLPVYVDEEKRLGCMSIGFLIPNRNSSVVWRGPKKTSMIKQFFTDVYWGDLDYLIVDTPPGTSDEHLAVVEYLQGFQPDGAILVTTPQAVALIDVRKELNFCRKTNLPILGLVENMSGYICPNCADCTNIFSSGGGEAMAEEFAIPFLGTLPIDPNLTSLFERKYQAQKPETTDEGSSFLEMYPKSSLHNHFTKIVDKLNLD